MTAGLYDQLQRENRRTTRRLLVWGVFLVAGLTWVLGALVVGPFVLEPSVGLSLLGVGAAAGVVTAATGYRSGPRLALRTAGARPPGPDEARRLQPLLDEVCVAAGIADHPPELHVVDDPAPNAFATGLARSGGHLVVTTGLVALLPRYELRAVLAHEVAHIVADDVRAVTVAVATAGLIGRLTGWVARLQDRERRRAEEGRAGFWSLVCIPFLYLASFAVALAPTTAQVIRAAVSREREFLADATGADLLRDPQSLVDALRRIRATGPVLRRFDLTTAHLWFDEPNLTAGVDVCARAAREFATHPPLDERVARLGTLHDGTVRTDGPLCAHVSQPPPPGGLPGATPGAARPPSVSGWRDGGRP